MTSIRVPQMARGTRSVSVLSEGSIKSETSYSSKIVSKARNNRSGLRKSVSHNYVEFNFESIRKEGKTIDFVLCFKDDLAAIELETGIQPVAAPSEVSTKRAAESIRRDSSKRLASVNNSIFTSPSETAKLQKQQSEIGEKLMKLRSQFLQNLKEKYKIEIIPNPKGSFNNFQGKPFNIKDYIFEGRKNFNESIADQSTRFIFLHIPFEVQEKIASEFKMVKPINPDIFKKFHDFTLEKLQDTKVFSRDKGNSKYSTALKRNIIIDPLVEDHVDSDHEDIEDEFLFYLDNNKQKIGKEIKEKIRKEELLILGDSNKILKNDKLWNHALQSEKDFNELYCKYENRKEAEKEQLEEQQAQNQEKRKTFKQNIMRHSIKRQSIVGSRRKLALKDIDDDLLDDDDAPIMSLRSKQPLNKNTAKKESKNRTDISSGCSSKSSRKEDLLTLSYSKLTDDEKKQLSCFSKTKEKIADIFNYLTDWMFQIDGDVGNSVLRLEYDPKYSEIFNNRFKQKKDQHGKITKTDNPDFFTHTEKSSMILKMLESTEITNLKFNDGQVIEKSLGIDSLKLLLQSKERSFCIFTKNRAQIIQAFSDYFPLHESISYSQDDETKEKYEKMNNKDLAKTSSSNKVEFDKFYEKFVESEVKKLNRDNNLPKKGLTKFFKNETITIPLPPYGLSKYKLEKHSSNTIDHLTNVEVKLSLENLKEYLGPEIGIYFAGIMFFAKHFAFPAIIGILPVLAGIFKVSFDWSSYVNEFCKEDRSNVTLKYQDTKGENFTFCPLASYRYQPVNEDKWDTVEGLCYEIKLAYILNNETNFFYALFLQIWGIFFLRRLTRYLNSLAVSWKLKIKNENQLESSQDSVEYLKPTYSIFGLGCFQSNIIKYDLDPQSFKMRPKVRSGIRNWGIIYSNTVYLLFLLFLILAYQLFSLYIYRILLKWIYNDLDQKGLKGSIWANTVFMVALLVLIFTFNGIQKWLIQKPWFALFIF